jgi:hypothetical protein
MSEYGNAFDRIAARWAVIENEHDKQHPDRGECGGIGHCSMMCAAVDLESTLIDTLRAWRQKQQS